MRIVENSSSCLTLRDRTLWLSVVFFAVALFIVAVFYFGQGDHRIMYPAGFFALFGVAFLRSTDAVFDKQARVCRMSQLNMFWVKRRQFAFDDINDVEIDTGPTSPSSQVPTYRLNLVTASGTVPLTAAYEANLKRQEAMREAILQAVAGGGAQPAGTDVVRTMVRQGRLVDAVRLIRERDGLDLATAQQRVMAMADEFKQG